MSIITTSRAKMKNGKLGNNQPSCRNQAARTQKNKISAIKRAERKSKSPGALRRAEERIARNLSNGIPRPSTLRKFARKEVPAV